MNAFVQLNIRYPADDAPRLIRHVEASGQSRVEYVVDAIRMRLDAETAAETAQATNE
jgi:hypothetical protein